MLAGIIVGIFLALVGIALFILRAVSKSRQQKYYDAAFKIVKEHCLNDAIKNSAEAVQGGLRPMVFLQWKDGEKAEYVFDPEYTVRIGRSPDMNEICIRDASVSKQHCILFVYQGQVYLKDCNARNGTWIKRGLSRIQVNDSILLLSGDKIIVGGMKIRVTLFSFDTTYL